MAAGDGEGRGVVRGEGKGRGAAPGEDELTESGVEREKALAEREGDTGMG